MLHIHPFSSLLLIGNKAAQVAAPPYDVISTTEARAYAEGRPYTFLRVTRPELELPKGTSSDTPEVHARAKANLDMLVEANLLRRETAPHILLYRLIGKGFKQIGVVGTFDLADYESGVIARHERTRVDKERERANHILACSAHTEPVFLAHRDDDAIADLVHRDVNDRPKFHFVAPDGITHTVWIVPNSKEYIEAFARLDRAYICDGHHRMAAAVTAAREAAAANGGVTPTEATRVLAVIFPISHLQIFAYNRLVRDLRGATPQAFLDSLGKVGTLVRTESPVPTRHGEVCVYLGRDGLGRDGLGRGELGGSELGGVEPGGGEPGGGEWWSLSFDPASIPKNDPIQALDVSLVQSRIFEPLLGIINPRTDERLDCVGGVRGPSALVEAVDSGRAAAAFSLFPTSMAELLAVTDAGEIMPPKSTWFEPKLRSGLFVHTF